MMYIKFILGQIKIGLMVLWSAIYVYRFKVYPKRAYLWGIRNLPQSQMPWYFWYADTYETQFGSDDKNFLNSFFGVYELLKKKVFREDGTWFWAADYEAFALLTEKQLYKMARKWGIWRNGVWNYIIRTAPIDGVKYFIRYLKDEGEGGPWTWRNKGKHGKQHVTWKDEDGKKYFRYSFTRKLRKFSPIRLFTKRDYINFQLGTGASNNRNNIKVRIFKYEPELYIKHVQNK